VGIIGVMVPSAFADFEIVIPENSSMDNGNEHFIPNSITVVQGDFVTWVNNDSMTAENSGKHYVSFQHTSGANITQLIEPGESYTIQFPDIGTINIMCHVHPWMLGEVIIIEKRDNYEIKNNSIGGECTEIGIWNQDTKTCTLTSDVPNSIVFKSNNIILDGNDHLIHSCDAYTPEPTFAQCIKIDAKSGIIIKNVNVEGRISVLDSFGVTLNNIDASGVDFSTSTTSTISNGNYYGISLYRSDDNIVENNSISASLLAQGDLSVVPYAVRHGIQIDNGAGNTIKNNIISGLYIGIDISSLDNNSNVIENNEISGSDVAIRLSTSENQIIKNNRVYENTRALDSITYEKRGGSNTIEKNMISDNAQGLWISSTGNTIIQNTFEDNIEYALQFGSQGSWTIFGGNTVINNNFIDNDRHVNGGDSNIFFTNEGGNFWSDYSLDCDDNNSDKICDEPYPFSGGTIGVNDQKVWTEKNAWENYPITSSVEVQPEPTPELETITPKIQKVPDWVRNIFVWYGEERISEDELIRGIQFLVKEGIIKIS